ncbi:tripartite tricarboxylate transporter TctB family protein [Lentibacillus jeotgali]|uniref:tripartite tricarboxylate transporter TctB family protein n=1 Tax=Lentibacillus jeotgali TaxID=558169 RepID=UPI0002628BD2|nr:tripartite tricarboxylate transporter TctB family protein [Lentibacillus jeotgali]
MDSNYFKVKEIYIYGLVVLLGLLLILVVIPMEVQKGEPRLFPFIYTTGLLIVGIANLFILAFNKNSNHFKFNKKIIKYVGLNILIYTAYIFLIQYVGFFALSVLFIIIQMRVLGEGWKMSIIISVVLPLSIYLLFTEILALYFPSGVLL